MQTRSANSGWRLMSPATSHMPCNKRKIDYCTPIFFFNRSQTSQWRLNSCQYERTHIIDQWRRSKRLQVELASLTQGTPASCRRWLQLSTCCRELCWSDGSLPCWECHQRTDDHQELVPSPPFVTLVDHKEVRLVLTEGRNVRAAPYWGQ